MVVGIFVVNIFVVGDTIKTLNVDSRFISRVSKMLYFNMRSCRIIGLALLLLLLVSTGAALAVPIAERTLPATVAPGEEFTVTVEVFEYGPAGQVIETFPAGFVYNNSTLGAGHVAVEGNEVTFTLLGEESFSYYIYASTTEGDYNFDGYIKDFDMNLSDVTGDTDVTVREGTTTEKTNSGGRR